MWCKEEKDIQGATLTLPSVIFGSLVFLSVKTLSPIFVSRNSIRDTFARIWREAFVTDQLEFDSSSQSCCLFFFRVTVGTHEGSWSIVQSQALSFPSHSLDRSRRILSDEWRNLYMPMEIIITPFLRLLLSDMLPTGLLSLSLPPPSLSPSLSLQSPWKNSRTNSNLSSSLNFTWIALFWVLVDLAAWGNWTRNSFLFFCYWLS